MHIALYLLIGLAIGTTSGALGVGGGVLLIPALLWLEGFDPRTAAGTSLLIMIVGATPAMWKYFSTGNLDLGAALWTGAAFAVGSYLGATLHVHHYLPERELRLAFGLLMLYVAVRFIVTSNSEAAIAAAGLFAIGLAWLAYLGLRVLGRRHLTRPDLGGKIRDLGQQPRGESDYYI